jgi:hypothetical protein
MAIVHVFLSVGRFRSFEEMRRFIDQTYTEDGEGVPSTFMREIRLLGHEPGCIEAIHSDRATPLLELLRGASYSDQWVLHLDSCRCVDAVICVFEPNVVQRPQASSLEYCGAFEYSPGGHEPS